MILFLLLFVSLLSMKYLTIIMNRIYCSGVNSIEVRLCNPKFLHENGGLVNLYNKLKTPLARGLFNLDIDYQLSDLNVT